MKKTQFTFCFLLIIITITLISLHRRGQHPHQQQQYQYHYHQYYQALKPTLAQELISTRDSQAWLSNAILPKPGKAIQPIDLIWTWANDSAPSGENADHLYRQHDELRYSLRSSFQSLPARFIRSRQIILPDDDSTLSQLSGKRLSQPTWLNHSNHQVLLKHHSQLFRFIYTHKPLQAAQWQRNYLPSHNSLAIESQFGHLDSVRDNLLYLNDDCFFINKFSPGDFSSELFGPVFRIQFDLRVSPDQVDRSGTEAARGEWPSLRYSNYLLNQRFGNRDRRYLSHLPKVLNIHILRELSEIWREEIFITASSRLRGQRRELNLMFLGTWYHIEKHREAMLHSFIMLKTDANQDGEISVDEWGEMMKRIGAKEEEEMIQVYKPFRPRRGVVEDGLGTSAPKETDYEWLSSDGYPLVGEPDRIPDYRHAEPVRTVVCRLNVSDCFPPHVREGRYGAEGLLRRVASEQPKCGDCLLALLVGQQPTGIEALLPPRTIRTQLAEWLDPRLSLATRPFATFNKRANLTLFFSVPFSFPIRFSRPILLTDDPRIWAIRNIQRYQYVLGTSPSKFDVLTTLAASRLVLDQLSDKFTKPASPSSSLPTGGNQLGKSAFLVTINDRIFRPHLRSVHALFSDWLNHSWPAPGPWEINY